MKSTFKMTFWATTNMDSTHQASADQLPTNFYYFKMNCMLLHLVHAHTVPQQLHYKETWAYEPLSPDRTPTSVMLHFYVALLRFNHILHHLSDPPQFTCTPQVLQILASMMLFSDEGRAVSLLVVICTVKWYIWLSCSIPYNTELWGNMV